MGLSGRRLKIVYINISIIIVYENQLAHRVSKIGSCFKLAFMLSYYVYVDLLHNIDLHGCRKAQINN